MAASPIFLLFLGILCFIFRPCAFEDSTVSCVYQSSCVLPCTFSPGSDVVITWTKREGGLNIHEYYHGQSQLQLQNENYRNRTALFEDQIDSGEASLRLTDVRVQDEGEYDCIYFIHDGSMTKTVRVRVTAPVVGVSLEKRGGDMVCISEKMFPRPNVTWGFSTEPQDEPRTTITSSESGLFSVFSSVSLTLTPPYEYICNISTEHSWKSATYRRNPSVDCSDSVTLACTQPKAPVQSLVWRSYKWTILTRTGSEEPVCTDVWWTPSVCHLTESNALVVDLDRFCLVEMFYCEVNTENETYIIVNEIIPVSYALDDSDLPEIRTNMRVRGRIIIILSVIFIAIIVIIIIVVTAFCLWRHQKVNKNRKQSEAMEQIRREEAASKPAGQKGLLELEELTKISEKFELNSEDSDVGSFKDISTTAGSDSSGYGKSECSWSMDSPLPF